MKIVYTLFIAAFVFNATKSQETDLNGRLTETNLLADYMSYDINKKEASICTALVVKGKIEHEDMVEQYKRKYQEAENEANNKASIKKVVAIGDNKARTIPDESKIDNTAQTVAKGPMNDNKIKTVTDLPKDDKVKISDDTLKGAINVQTVADLPNDNNKATDIGSNEIPPSKGNKATRLLGEDDVSSKTQTSNTNLNNSVKSSDDPKTKKETTEAPLHTIYAECVSPRSEGNKKIIKEYYTVCNGKDMKFEPLNTVTEKTMSLAFSDKPNMFVFATAEYPVHLNHNLVLTDSCTFRAISLFAWRVAASLLVLAANYL